MKYSDIATATQKLQNYIEAENYSGYDPYDALKSPLFKLPFLKSNKWIRFATQQLVKRSSINLRPLLFVPKGINPVTLGLCVQAYCNLIKVYPKKKIELETKINSLINQLEKLIPKSYHGACWGYNFDWEARYSNIGAYQPTIVATGIVTNALFQTFKLTGNKQAFALCESATKFVLNDLNRIYDKENNFCFSYTPFDHQSVFNANMKGVRLLSQVYSITQNDSMKIEAKNAVTFVINEQREDGAWIYSKSKTGGWIDNYHTGYILDCLDEYIKLTGDKSVELNLKKGFEFYRNNFFTEDFIPKFYAHKIYPVDCTSASQSILTLLRFGNIQAAQGVAEWMMKNMQDNKGFFYFRKTKNFTLKTSFMRWSNAWMFAALSNFLEQNPYI